MASTSTPLYYQCQRSGNCCRRPGFVRITEREIPGMAACLGISETEFIERHTRLTPQRTGLALTDKPGGECFFLQGVECLLQAAKPEQCVGFPNTWNFPGWREMCQAVAVNPKTNHETANP